MSNVAIVTDSNSGITQAAGKELGIYVLPMPFMIDEETYFEDIDLTQEQFYEKLASGANIATSQPSPESVMNLWDKVLEEHDELVHIPMSSGLSGSGGRRAGAGGEHSADFGDPAAVLSGREALGGQGEERRGNQGVPGRG